MFKIQLENQDGMRYTYFCGSVCTYTSTKGLNLAYMSP